MAPEQGREDDPEASLLSRRQYLLATGALAGTASVGVGPAAAADVTLDAMTVSADHTWSTVQVSNSYSTPVVVAPALSFAGTNPASPRVRNVASDGFELSVEEWRYLDGRHLSESVGCFVLDSGEHTSADGRKLVAGTVQTDHHWTSVSFPTAFASTPVVFSNAQTENGRQPVVTRHSDVSGSGMQVRLQEEEALGPHLDEDVGYLAIEPGVGTVGGRPYEASRDVKAGSTWRTISFSGSYEQPIFLADIQTTLGTNTATVRYRNLSGSGVEVKVEEERSADREINHLPERIGYLVIEGESQTDTETGYGLGGYGEGGYGQ